MTVLFTPLKVGEINLENRIIMAPLTRARAINKRIPNELMLEYYLQRSGAGLIITEATSVTPMGVGYANTPGIWNEEHVSGWKKITHALHEKKTPIFLQLWHVGRVSDPTFLNGELPVAPSAIAPEGHVSLLRPYKNYVTPRALDLREIPGIVEAYKQGARLAKEAGFDGVEIHGANGYLLDQFLHDGSNKRVDEYGGSIPNRARLLLEVVDAVIDVFGKGRVGVHLSPNGTSHSMLDSNPLETFSYVARELGRREIAFIFVRENREGEKRLLSVIKKEFKGVVIANEKLTKESAEELIEEGAADAAAFGVPFIANPDLPRRMKDSLPLNKPVPETFYGSGKEGYTDYVFYDE